MPEVTNRRNDTDVVRISDGENISDGIYIMADV